MVTTAGFRFCEINFVDNVEYCAKWNHTLYETFSFDEKYLKEEYDIFIDDNSLLELIETDRSSWISNE